MWLDWTFFDDSSISTDTNGFFCILKGGSDICISSSLKGIFGSSIKGEFGSSLKGEFGSSLKANSDDMLNDSLDNKRDFTWDNSNGERGDT
jgi:hypothetical protein